MTITDTQTAPDPHLWVPQRRVDDLDWFRKKYAAERDKRLPLTGSDSYQPIEFAGEYDSFNADPHVDGPRTLPPQTAEIDVLVIGAGFMGLTAGIELMKRGITSFRIIDAAADFGGTWYWNRYPGVRCDVESYIYMPYLEETGYVPTERYVLGSEIFAYCQFLAEQHDLYGKAIFQTRVTGIEWNAETDRWVVQTSGGDELHARFVATQSGLFSRPHLPGIPGIEEFQGDSFHASRWDYRVTGGDTGGNLNKLHDKRVAIIGTGATGVQVIPQLAKYAESLVVFQRTPTQVAPRENAPTDVDWFTSLPKGWHQERRAAFDKCAIDRATPESDVDDGWIKFARWQMQSVYEAGGETPTIEQYLDAFERSDYEWNEMLRDRVDSIVTDPKKAKKLKSYYRTMCKRPGFSDEYLPTFNRNNVEIVDTSETPIERITEHAIIARGEEYEVDLIVYATGYQHGRTWTDKAGYDVTGRNGNTFSEKFANGLSTFHGFLSKDFPNMFLLGFTQTGQATNVAHLLDQQVNHIVYIIDKCLTDGITTVEPTAEAEEGWNEVLRVQTESRRDWLTTCTPGHYNNEGRIDDHRNPLIVGVYGPGYEFFDLIKTWREDDKFDGLSVTR